MPDALISRITSRAPGVGSGNSRSSSLRSPRNTTPFMAFSRPSLVQQRDDARRSRFLDDHAQVHDPHRGVLAGFASVSFRWPRPPAAARQRAFYARPGGWGISIRTMLRGGGTLTPS